MKRKRVKKLTLHRETLRALSGDELRQADGGASFQSDCRSDCICPTLSIGECFTLQWTGCPLC